MSSIFQEPHLHPLFERRRGAAHPSTRERYPAGRARTLRAALLLAALSGGAGCGAEADEQNPLAVGARDLIAARAATADFTLASPPLAFTPRAVLEAGPVLDSVPHEVVVSGLTQASGQKTRVECAQRYYLRPASGLSECPGAERNGAICYPRCEEGFAGAGPVCWENCPPGYANDGITCRLDPDTQPLDTSSCPWYDTCGTWHDCEGECPDGYSKTPCTCFRNADIFARASYGRGVGSPMSCPPDRQQLGALCYENCPEGYRNDGIVCRETRETCTEVPVPEPAPPTRAFCYELHDPGSTVQPCIAGGLVSDTEEHARQQIKNGHCSDRDCSISIIDCAGIQNACR